VIFSDIFGAKSGRHRNVADLFAAMGYQVFLPELLITPYEADFPSIIDNVKGQDFELMNEKFQKVLKLL
jgi:dienelactone hydrolase